MEIKKIDDHDNNSDNDINIIYFRGSQKTRSISIKMRTLKIGFYLLAMVAAWSFVSTILLYFTVVDRHQQVANFQKSKSVIFQMQTRYENVYDIERVLPVLPEEVGNKNLVKVDQAVVVPLEDNLEDRKSKISDEDTKIDSSEEEGLVDLKSEVVIGEVEKSPKTWLENSVVAKERRIWQEGSYLNIEFVIRNKDRSRKLNGHVWAYAKIKRGNDRTILKGYPRGLKIDEKGEMISNERGGVRFKIRRYKLEKFKVFVGSLSKDHLIEVGVYLKSQSGDVHIKKFDQSNVIFEKKNSKEAKARVSRDRMNN